MGAASTEPNQVSHMSPFRLKLLIKTSAGRQNGSFQKSDINVFFCKKGLFIWAEELMVHISLHIMSLCKAEDLFIFFFGKRIRCWITPVPRDVSCQTSMTAEEYQDEESLYKSVQTQYSLFLKAVVCREYRQPFVPTSPMMTSTPETLQHPGVQPRPFVYVRRPFPARFSRGHWMPVHHLSY